MKRVLFILLLFPSCRKFLDVPVPEDQLLSERIFTDDEKAQAALSAIYGQLVNSGASFANALTTLAAGYSADELRRFSPTPADSELMGNQLSSGNTAVAALWKTAYQTIYYANAVYKGAEPATGLSPAVRRQLLGESRFLRAFAYFYLVNFFGDVPLVLNTGYRENAVLPRAATAIVFGQIIADLEEAASLLPAAYPVGERIRPNRWAVLSLLARVYLYRGDWAAAEAAATAVIGSGDYLPLPDTDAAFLKDSREAIFQLVPRTGTLTKTGMVRPVNGIPQVYMTENLETSFPAGDARRHWMDSITYLGKKYYYPAKYKNTTSAITEYYIVLRLSEQYLIRAEARVRQNKAGAADDLNVLRERAGLPLLSAGTQAQLIAAIEEERKRELFAEWGHRWFDLKRWKKAATVLRSLKEHWQDTDVLYPVPLEELLLNPVLEQNEGY